MPRRVDRQAYRSDFIQRSTELFAKEGYTALTMREIAAHLGVSTGTLYHYFPSKEALFLDVVEAVGRRDMLSARTEIPLGLSTAERAAAVLGFVEAMEPYFVQQQLVLMEYFRSRDPKAIQKDKALLKASSFYERSVADLLGVGRKDARAIIIFLEGLLLQRLYDGGRTRFKDQAPYVEALLKIGGST
jgi:AcrR family transcriptional regulator